MTELGQILADDGHPIQLTEGSDDNTGYEYTILGVSPYRFYMLIKELGFEFSHYHNWAEVTPGSAHQVWKLDGVQLEIYQPPDECAGDIMLLANRRLI